jgi:hypothetical protein
MLSDFLIVVKEGRILHFVSGYRMFELNDHLGRLAPSFGRRGLAEGDAQKMPKGYFLNAPPYFTPGLHQVFNINKMF